MAPGWKYYGARGIKVSDEWVHNFENFYQHVGPKPSPDHSLDRINNDGNYEPGNVRWATPAVQANNSRRVRYLSHNGVKRSLKEWVEETGLQYDTLCARLYRGLSDSEAITKPLNYHPKKVRA